MLVPAVFDVRSLTASVSEYGDDVRVVGNRLLRIECAAARRVQCQHPLAEQGAGADVRGGVRAERVLAVDREADERIAVDEFDRRHRTDLDPRHGDVIARDNAACLGEQRLIPQRRRPLDEPLGLQPDGDDENDQDNADEARPDQLVSAVLQHLAVHAPSRILLDPRELDGVSLKVAGAEGDSTDVVREERAVAADPSELAVDLGQSLDGRVEARQVIVDQAGPAC